MLPSLFLNSFSEGSYMQPPQLATPTVCPRKQLATFFILRIRSLEIRAGKNELKFWHPEPHQMQGWELLLKLPHAQGHLLMHGHILSTHPGIVGANWLRIPGTQQRQRDLCPEYLRAGGAGGGG